MVANAALLRGAGWSRYYWLLLGRTVGYNLAVAVVALVLGLPGALVVGRGRGVVSRVLVAMMPLAMLIPSLVYTYGWLQVLRMLGLTFAPGSAADVGRYIVVLGFWLWPVAALTIGVHLRGLDWHIQEQALLDGGLRRVTCRMLLGPALASAAIVLGLGMQEFVIYETTGISVVATEIRTVFETGSLIASHVDSPSPSQAQRAASAVFVGLPVVILTGLLFYWAFCLLRRGSWKLQAAGGWPRLLEAPWWAKAGTGLVLLCTALLPIVAMGLSLRRPFSLRHAWAVLGQHVAGSLLVASLTGIVGLGLGLLACVSRLRGLLWVSLATFLTGGELLAIAYIRIYSRAAPWPLSLIRIAGQDFFGWIYDGVAVTVLACVGRFAWLALLAGRTSWWSACREFRDMAAVDGAGAWQTARHVVWPLVWPVLLASAGLMGLMSLTEVPATALLAPQNPPMLVTMLLVWVHNLRYDDMLEACLLLTGLVILLGGGILALGWAGLRAVTARKRRLAIVAWALIPLVQAGCDRPSMPESIWCQSGTGPGQVVYPRAICYSMFDDSFYVVDKMARVQHLDGQGRWLNEWQMPQWAAGKPVGLSVGPDGNVYVADTHYQRVMVYQPDGTLARSWGTAGRGPGQFMYPTDVAFDQSGQIYVSEYGDNDRVQVFDGQGRFLRQFGRFGQGQGEFSRPQSLVVDGQHVYVADACNHRIAVFTTEGRFLRNMGSVGSGLGQFRFPYGLALDREGRLVVAEFGNHRVQLVDKETGQGLKTWGLAGRRPGQLACPWAVAVDRSGRVAAVDSGNDRIQVFRW